MAETLLAVDFGGSFTKIFKKGCGLVLKESTLLGAVMTDNGYEVKVMGNEAREIQGKTDDRTVIFSPISEGVIKSPEYATILLKYFFNKVVEKKSPFKKIKCLVSVPIGLTQEEKDVYYSVFNNAGIKEVMFIPRLLCPAYGSGVNVFANSATMIVDMGGVSTDIGVVNLGTLIDGATLAVGGKSVDGQIIRHVSNKYGVEIGLSSAQKIKEEIGSLYSNDTANMDIVGVNLKTKAPSNVVVYATDVKQAVLPLLTEIIRIIETTLNILPPEISADISKNGIVLTGGLANISGIERYFRYELNLPVIVADEPENSNILGAGKFLSNINELKKIISEL